MSKKNIFFAGESLFSCEQHEYKTAINKVNSYIITFLV
jgi:hypothetical protein